MKKFYLRKGIGSWSSGTQVEVFNWPGSPKPFEVREGMIEVRILAGDRPIIEVPEDYVVERRDRSL
jgi:hypothetical protein